MKVVIIGFVIILFVLSCGLAVRYSQNANSAQQQLDGERYKRLVSEENLEKAKVQISSLQAELKKTQEKVAQIENILEKTKVLNTSLKVRLDKADVMKAVLEKKIEKLQNIALPM